MAVELIVGAALGVVVGVVAKDKLIGNVNTAKEQSKQREFDNLYQENEKIRMRNKDMSRQIEDLISDNTKLRNQYKAKDDGVDDLEDEIKDLKKQISKLLSEKQELLFRNQEYKITCASRDNEISDLKLKLESYI